MGFIIIWSGFPCDSDGMMDILQGHAENETDKQINRDS